MRLKDRMRLMNPLDLEGPNPPVADAKMFICVSRYAGTNFSYG